ncbi:insulinase family protein [Halosquirtibacter xylanolyticus]|uniref:M16 family metallopeptidase n=1 Tax=Halosquirtibacter xylanolyticus TaxID=3374599 RepID=UPI003747E2DC|nr:insulinase family protein [Prolixibacteraceae bacterium]
MRKLLSLCVVVLSLCSITTVQAQVSMDSPLPLEQTIRKGVLPNGLTYYIRHNEEPKERASFYIVQNVGALLENDDQNGLAHFLEHMAFNGTENFKGKGVLNTLQKHGVEFGRNINAYTAFNETAYNLSEVPTGPKGLVDTCLLVLHDWTNYLLLTEEEIDSERGVISEEWRTRRNAGFRVRQQFFPVLFKDSKYAVRDIIGDYDLINNFEYNTLRNFYHDWYRTDLQCIIVVGDIDVEEVEGKIKKMFTEVPAVKDAKPRPFFEVPDHNETYFVQALDKEMSRTSVTMYKVQKNTAKNPETVIDYRNDMVTSLMNQMLGARISELIQKGNPPFIYGDVSLSGFVRGYDAFSVSCGIKPGEEKKGFQAILNEWERAERFGFLNSELERAKLNILSALESRYKDRAKISNDSYCREMQQNFLTGAAVIGIEGEYQLAQALLPSITVKDVNALIEKCSEEGNRTVVVSGPTEGEKHLTKEEALSMITAVKAANLEPYKDAVSNEPLVDETKVKAGTIVSEKVLPQFDAKEWTLSNGSKVYYRFADIDKDKVSLVGYSWGGTSIVSDIKELPSASYASSFAENYGAGNFDAIALKKMLTGKRVGVSMNINDLQEKIQASSVPADFETMMQLLYLKFESPRFDKDAFDALKSRYAAFVASLSNNPDVIKRDSISLITNDHNPRVMNLSPAFIESLDFDMMKKTYLDRMQDASDFTFVLVGNVKEDEAKKMVCKYIASLTSTNRKEKFVDRRVTFPKENVETVIPIKLETPKTTEYMEFNQYMPYSAHNDLCMDIVQAVLDLRFTEKVREEAGGTYGVVVRASFSQYPKSQASLLIRFDCKPDRSKELMEVVKAQITQMLKEGISEEDYNKTVKNIQKNLEQGKNHNSYYANVISAYAVKGIDKTSKKSDPEVVLANTSKKDVEKFARKFFKKAKRIHIEFVPEQ